MRHDALASSLLFPALILFCTTLKASPLVELRLQAPASCPSRGAIESTLARLVTQPPSAPLSVSARLMPQDGRWILFAALENGQRVIAGDTCVAVAEALVVIMALAIDPKATLGAEAFQEFERANAPALAAPPAAATAPSDAAGASQSGGRWRSYEDAPPTRVSVPQRPEQGSIGENRWGWSLLILSELGMLPAWSLGPSLATRYGSSTLWGEVALSTLLPRFAGADANPSKGGRLGWFGARVAACAGLGAGLPIAACAGIESGDLYGRAVNTAYYRTGYAFLSALTAGIVYRGQLRRDWGLELRLGSAVPFWRPVFGLDGYGEVFRPSQASFRAEIGFAWR